MRRNIPTLNRLWLRVESLSVCAAVSSTERESGGGEPPSAEPNPDAEPAESGAAGKVHGEQGAVP